MTGQPEQPEYEGPKDQPGAGEKQFVISVEVVPPSGPDASVPSRYGVWLPRRWPRTSGPGPWTARPTGRSWRARGAPR